MFPIIPELWHRFLRAARFPALVIILLFLALSAGAAGPLYWDMPDGRPFTACNLEGVKITADGYLGPGLPRGERVELNEDVVWTTVSDGKGGFFLGTGNHGRILWLNAKGDLFTWADLDCDEVLSLEVLSDGRVVAGCEPDGQVFLVGGDAKAKAVGKIGGGYIWAMTRDDRGLIYLATGSPAALSVLDPAQGTLNQLTTFPAENALDVAVTDNGELLVATQGPGLVYRLDPAHPDHVAVVLQAAQGEVNTLVRGPGGGFCALAVNSEQSDLDVALGSAVNPPRGAPPRSVVMIPGAEAGQRAKVPSAALYDLESPISPAVIWSGNLDLIAVVHVPDLGWVAGGLRGKDQPLTVLYRLVPPGDREVLTSWQGGDIVVLQPGQAPATVGVVQVHPSRYDVFGSGIKGDRTATGPVLDAGRPVAWGRLSWAGDATGGKLRWSARTGNREFADESWSDWSGAWSEENHRLAVPAGRYLQWRVDFPPGMVASSMRLTGVTVSAWGKNRAPVITDFRRENLEGVRQGGLMAQRPNLTRNFASGLKAEFNRAETPARPQPAERVKLGNAVVVFSWKADDPDQDGLEYVLACRKRGASVWQDVATGSDAQLDAWDTSSVPDGIYDVRLKVSDSPDNPAENVMSSEREYGPVVVDNTPPEILDLAADYAAGVLELNFKAQDEASPLAGAFLVNADGSRERLDPQDRICDSTREAFTCRHPITGADNPPAWVQVEVLDARGNLGVGKCRVKGE